MDLATRKLETDRHRNGAGAHDAEISREKFRPIGGEDRDTRAPRKPASGERARNCVGHGIKMSIGKLARRVLAPQIDDRDFLQVAVAPNEVAKIGEAGHL